MASVSSIQIWTLIVAAVAALAGIAGIVLSAVFARRAETHVFVRNLRHTKYEELEEVANELLIQQFGEVSMAFGRGGPIAMHERAARMGTIGAALDLSSAPIQGFAKLDASKHFPDLDTLAKNCQLAATALGEWMYELTPENQDNATTAVHEGVQSLVEIATQFVVTSVWTQLVSPDVSSSPQTDREQTRPHRQCNLDSPRWLCVPRRRKGHGTARGVREPFWTRRAPLRLEHAELGAFGNKPRRPPFPGHVRDSLRAWRSPEQSSQGSRRLAALLSARRTATRWCGPMVSVPPLASIAASMPGTTVARGRTARGRRRTTGGNYHPRAPSSQKATTEQPKRIPPRRFMCDPLGCPGQPRRPALPFLVCRFPTPQDIGVTA